MMPEIPQAVRAWVYRVLLALQPVVVAYGWLSEQEAVLWVGVASAVLGLGLAAVHTPRKDKPGVQPFNMHID